MQMFGEIPEWLILWIEKQQTFWVASAPLTADGLVNISPKGVAGTFHVAGPRKVWYEDLSGSGVETIAHIRENGRVTILLNAFEGPPRIVRLYGKGSVHEFGTPEYEALLPEGTRHPGSRAAICLDVFKVATVRMSLNLSYAAHTCGYSVPFYEFKAHRTQLLEWAARKEGTDRDSETTVGYSSATTPRVQTGMKKWWEERNTTSLDGLPGLASAHVSNEIFRHQPVAKRSSLEKGTGLKSKIAFTLPPLDFRIVIAFFVGMLVTASYQRLAIAAHAILLT
ncbi:hypothetical protein DXG03_004710 [Asterophora parasitica]|uniref:Pyridoxamine 5'-phosphate oxidase putative domain-containing protein n=1 Tax=Asterophora parasitica TaxID=117018 RepID=A0A9P7G2G0_9AGAR|nr:hypothetical protein DXG03_004710 [Asterophora parasitica]